MKKLMSMQRGIMTCAIHNNRMVICKAYALHIFQRGRTINYITIFNCCFYILFIIPAIFNYLTVWKIGGLIQIWDLNSLNSGSKNFILFHLRIGFETKIKSTSAIMNDCEVMQIRSLKQIARQVNEQRIQLRTRSSTKKKPS